jgi:endoglycosylceramidase
MQRRAARFVLASSSVLFFVSALGCSSGSSAPPAPGPTARACSITIPDAADWRLRTDGTVLRDAHGRVVTLRGVDAGGRSKTAPFAPFDFTDATYEQALGSYMDRAAGWGVDVMRVPFMWAAVEPTQGADDAAFLARFDRLLDAAWARGIRTVIDFHQDVYAENFCGDGFPAWTLPDPKPAPHHDCQSWVTQYSTQPVMSAFDRFWTTGSVQTAYLALWDRLAARYKDHPGVIGFEPINEPSPGSANADDWETTTLSSFFTMMTSKLRAAAPSTLVFIDLTGSDGAFLISKVQRPSGPGSDGVVFAPHFYPFLAGDAATTMTQMQTWATIGSQWNTPTFVGELGVKGDGDSQRASMEATYAALDALGLGSAQWEYSVSTTSWDDEGMSIVDADGTEHGLVGAIARPFARAVAGSAITVAWDASSRTFDLTYAPTEGGVSEIAFPRRAFPSGYNVALTGACFDETQGPMLLQAEPGAAKVTLRISAR